MAYNGKLVIDIEDDDPIVLNLSYSDSDGLLTGYTRYCIFDGMIKRPIIEDSVEVPREVLIGESLRIQLFFNKDRLKYYSLNIITAKLNRIIRGQ